MSVVLWILQVLLAAVFFAHGGFMVAPPADMVTMINEQMSVGLRLFIGVAEILAGFGLLLPGLTRILPFLTVLAGAGLMTIMTCATVLHLFRGEYSSAMTCVVILLVTTVVTYGRWKVRPFTARALRTNVATLPTS